LGSAIFTFAPFVFGALMDIEDTFVYHSETGLVRAPPSCIVGSSDVILRVGADVGVDVVVGIEFSDRSLDVVDVLSV
jgi:hypothetical protein